MNLSRIILVSKETLDRMEARNVRMVGRGIEKPASYADDRDFVAISITERGYERLRKIADDPVVFDPNAALERLLDDLDGLEAGEDGG